MATKRTDRDNHRQHYRAILREETLVRVVVWTAASAAALAATLLAWNAW